MTFFRIIQALFSSQRLNRQYVYFNQVLQNMGRSYITGSNNQPVIYLYTKEDCSLCEEAKKALKPYMHRFHLEEVDITLPENKDWYEKYKNDIPVFHIFDNFLFMHRVDINILEKALKDFENKT